MSPLRTLRKRDARVSAAVGLLMGLGGCFTDAVPSAAGSSGPGTTTTTGSRPDPAGPSTAASGTIETGDDTTGVVDSTTVAPSTTSTTTQADTSTGCSPTCADQACGIEPACGTSCGECSMPGQGVPFAGCVEQGHWYCGLRLGFPLMFGPSPPLNADLVIGYRVTLVQQRTVRALGLLTAGAGDAPVRMALYAHDVPTDTPAALLAETGAVAVANGHNLYPIDYPDPLPAGDYWVMLHSGLPLTLFRTQSIEHELFLLTDVPFDPNASAFPPELTGQPLSTNFRYNLYMVVEDEPLP